VNRHQRIATALLWALLWPMVGASGQDGANRGNRAKDGEWPTYGADLACSRYRPLDQINASNFSTLEVAWRFKTDSLGNRPEYKLEGTPLMVNGVVYATAGSRRAAIALDAGCMASMKARAAPRLLGNCRAAASLTGPMVNRSGSSM
jgi:glucose dehydrogenase